MNFKKRTVFPTLMEPPRLNNWWFWGAMGVGGGMWGGIIWGVRYIL